MKTVSLLTLLLLALPAAAVADEPDLTCFSPAGTEDLRYEWRLRGGLAWIAGLAFPTSGWGQFRTSRLSESRNRINSELLITSDGGRDGYYRYESEIDARSTRTLNSYHGYSWGRKHRSARTSFDYPKGQARTSKESYKRKEPTHRVRTIPDGPLRDVLTGILYLRQNAEQIIRPVSSQIYSDGDLYPIVFRPAGTERIEFEGETLDVRCFEISAAASGAQKWPGGVRVCLTEDARRLPLRIKILRNYASLNLELTGVSSCGSALAGPSPATSRTPIR